MKAKIKRGSLQELKAIVTDKISEAKIQMNIRRDKISCGDHNIIDLVVFKLEGKVEALMQTLNYINIMISEGYEDERDEDDES